MNTTNYNTAFFAISSLILLQGFLAYLLDIRAEGFANSKLKGESSLIFN
ncbi:MAG: hypothetical protein SGJ10_03610 [Bacteroidota bacterium]|nr:hypothetical protein [Bacteroidota bacterium]